MPVSRRAATAWLDQLEALETTNPGMPEGLLDLVRSCGASIAGSQPVGIFAIAVRKDRLLRYRKAHPEVTARVLEIWKAFEMFNSSETMGC